MTARRTLLASRSMMVCALTAQLMCACLFAENQTSEASRAATVVESMPHAQKIKNVALSPDGTQVAYIVKKEIAVVPVGGGSSRTITVASKLELRDLAWSADGKHLAFIADLPGDVPAGPLEPMIPLAGVIGEKIYEQRIATLDLGNDHLAQVTPPGMYVYEYEWTPDSEGWIATAAHGAGDAQWYVARLYFANARTGEMREIYKPKLQIAEPRVSFDGKNVAFIEGLMSDEGSTGGDIYVVPITGGAARNLTPGIKSSPSALVWTGPERITFAENVDGNSGFGSVRTPGGAPETLWTGEEMAEPAENGWVPGPSSRGANSITAIVRQSARTPPEVWVGTIGNWKQISNLNSEVKPDWGEMRNVNWMSGSTRVQGWLMLPKDFAPGKRYPLIVNVHGGPSSACKSRWDERFMSAQSAMGYFALCPNPRGSYGQGEAFTQANVKDFGGRDFRDIMAGVDALSGKYPIDSKRVGIRGHSYGGYMTMWAETQTPRFAAAVAGAGLSDWLSYYGLNDIDEWMIPFFGASVYDDPEVYAKSDPMHFVKAVRTPTLLLVGDRDGEVPMEQSVEWWHALETLHVPTKLVVYANEGHAIGRPADAHDYDVRSLQWFEEWFAKVR